MACVDDVIADVALGANLGDAVQTLRAAADALAALPLTGLVARSWLYRSAPVEATGPDYFNAVVRLHTALAPEALLEHLLALEARFGRQRRPGERHAPRPLDLDLLRYGDLRRQTAVLTLPHPRIGERAFVLWPLADVWPEGTFDGEPLAMRAARLRDAGQAIERIEPL